MPQKRKSVRKQSRKQARPAGVARYSPTPPLAGKSHRCKLVFCAPFSLSDGGGAAAFYNFYRLNGPYDPDTAVLSQATPGLAAIAQLYRAMRVWSADVSVVANAYGDACIMLSLVPTAFQPVLPSNPDFWPVQRLTKTAPMVPRGYEGNSNRFVMHTTVNQRFDLPSVANITKDQYRDEADYASLTNGNPTRQLYVAIAFSRVIQGAVTNYANGYVRIAYDVEFYEPYPLQ